MQPFQFARALLARVGDVGDVTQTVKVITGEVRKATGGQQTPYVYMALSVDFTLNLETSSNQAKRPVFTVEKEYGSLTIDVRTRGTLFINGNSMRQVTPGTSARLDEVETGQVSLEILYEDGNDEIQRVEVSNKTVTAVTFTYVKRPPVPENMVLVEGGTFQMGDIFGDGNEWEKPVHSVTVSTFLLGKYLVTVADFREFANATGYYTQAERQGGAYVWTGSNWEQKPDANWKNPYMQQSDQDPVTCVSWFDAIVYCNWLSRKGGLDSCYTIDGRNVACDFSKNGFRLPTEAEWEYAAKGGRRSRSCKFAGDNIAEAVGWYFANSEGRTHPVGQKKPNELGLFDMTGNVLEWCGDWYGTYSAAAQTEPLGAFSGDYRVVRGGSWGAKEMDVRTASRGWFGPDERSYTLGLRVVARTP